jgi:DUF4097 and DUF4098 domain-containing protein YvlB
MLISSLVTVLVGVLLSQDTQIVQKGQYWERTWPGTLTVMPQAQLRVVTRGNVVLRGSKGDSVTYQLVERVKARTREDAHRLLSGSTTSKTMRPGLATLTVVPIADRNSMAVLQVNVPQQLMGAIIETEDGDVEAYDFEGSLRLGTTAGMIRCDRIRGSVQGRTGGGEIRLGKIGGAVRCASAAGSIFVDSAGADASCQTAGGEITVREARGPLVLSTEGGNIQVEKAGSSVEAHSAQGIIEVFQAAGAVFADTRGGSIQVGSARGVKCESVAGAIRVKTSSSPLQVSTAMGSILAELLAGTRLDDSSLVAGAGDVTVLIPSNLALSVMARNDSGGNPRIVSDFSEVPVRRIGPRRPPLVAEGSINGGGPVLRINVADGTIYLRKLKQ